MLEEEKHEKGKVEWHRIEIGNRMSIDRSNRQSESRQLQGTATTCNVAWLSASIVSSLYDQTYL